MHFDWKRFCSENGIPFVTYGPHTTQGNINIRCPYCAGSERSEHMGLCLDVTKPAWHCWRNSRHSGYNPRRLVQKLLGCSYTTAMGILKIQYAAPEDAELQTAIEGLQPRASEPAVVPTILKLPAEFKPIKQGGLYAARFVNYLSVDRGFGASTMEIAETYNLQYALSGDFAWRVIIPFYAQHQLIGWTGRDIRIKPRLRYNTYGNKNFIFNSDNALKSEATTLFIVEGTFDAIKLHWFGDCAAVAVLGAAITQTQIGQLAGIVRRFERSVVLLDRDTLADGMPLAQEIEELSGRPVKCKFLTEYKDPGVIPSSLIPRLCKQLAAST